MLFINDLWMESFNILFTLSALNKIGLDFVYLTNVTRSGRKDYNMKKNNGDYFNLYITGYALGLITYLSALPLCIINNYHFNTLRTYTQYVCESSLNTKIDSGKPKS